MAKRIAVEDIKTCANAYFISERSTEDGRKALQGFVTGLLLKADNYQGFGYIELINGGHDQWNADGRVRDIMSYVKDQTRIVYY